jgi:hypothetical protein
MVAAKLAVIAPHLPPFVPHTLAIALAALPPELMPVAPEFAPVTPQCAMIPMDLTAVMAHLPMTGVLAEGLLRAGGRGRQETEKHYRTECQAKPHVPILR